MKPFIREEIHAHAASAGPSPNVCAPPRVAVAYDRTVPRAVVHRAAVSTVLVTDLCAVAQQSFHVGVQWPRDHSYYRTHIGQHDPMLVAESIRQAALAIAHLHYGVPLDWQFMTCAKSYRVRPEGLTIGARPAEVLLVVNCHDVQRTRLGLRGMRMTVDCYRGREWIGCGEVGWKCASPAAYRRLRGERFGVTASPVALPTPVEPAAVGRDLEQDVTIGATPRFEDCLLRIVPGHPALYDHPVDHVPGMALLESARQAALRITGNPDALAVAMSVTFDNYVEHDPPATVHATAAAGAPANAQSVSFTIDQFGRHTASGSFAVVPAS
jgi:hypothetical protein